MSRADTREDKRRLEIPELGKTKEHKYPCGTVHSLVWSACPNCGKTRWLSRGKQSQRLCQPCANRKRALIYKGTKSANWKGGRHKNEQGYIMVYCPEHPNAKSHYYVPEHRLVMEQALGRYLSRSEQVHHINGIRDDNRLENLSLLSPRDHTVQDKICKNCSLKKEIRLLRWELKQLREALQLKLGS